jgi:hypothetical protein
MERPNGNSSRSFRGVEQRDSGGSFVDSEDVSGYGVSYQGIDFFLPNGIDIDQEKLNSRGLTDKQRQNVLKISEKRRLLQSLNLQLSQAKKGLSKTEFDDPEDRPRSKTQDPSKISARIEALESEIADLVESISESIGSIGNDALIDKTIFEHDVFGDGEVVDTVKRLRVSESQPSNPDIPPIEDSENLDSVAKKLRKLYDLKQSAEQKLAQFDSEKKLNEIAGDDDEIDPLDAFMASTTVDLADEGISKTRSDLEEIDLFISKFESLRKFLSNGQSSTTISAAIEQQQKIRHKTVTEPTTSEPRGTGTVWEDEFRKDEAVPKRGFVSSSKVTAPPPIRLDATRGGLQVPGAIAQTFPTQTPSWSPPDEDQEQTQEKLRRKLGY